MKVYFKFHNSLSAGNLHTTLTAPSGNVVPIQLIQDELLTPLRFAHLDKRIRDKYFEPVIVKSADVFFSFGVRFMSE